MLIATNLGKAAVSFGVGSYVLNWVLEYGYGKIIAGAFTAVLLASNMLVFVFIFWGKSIRVAMAKSWLGRFLARTRTVE